MAQSLGQNTESRISDISSGTADGFLFAGEQHESTVFGFCLLFFPWVISFTSQDAVIQSPDGGFDNRVLVVGLPPAYQSHFLSLLSWLSLIFSSSAAKGFIVVYLFLEWSHREYHRVYHPAAWWCLNTGAYLWGCEWSRQVPFYAEV